MTAVTLGRYFLGSQLFIQGFVLCCVLRSRPYLGNCTVDA